MVTPLDAIRDAARVDILETGERICKHDERMVVAGKDGDGDGSRHGRMKERKQLKRGRSKTREDGGGA